MKLNREGIELIKRLEGFRISAYPCSAGVWTIGYGTTVYTNGVKVKKGDKTTNLEADAMLWHDCLKLEKELKEFLDFHLIVIRENKFNALISFFYNLGTKWLYEDTRLAYCLKYDKPMLPGAMLLYINVNGKKNQGIINRRIAEVSHYLKL